MRTPQFKNEETAMAAVSEMVDSIHKTLLQITEIADQYGLRVEILREWGNYLTYQGRRYHNDVDYDLYDDREWYSSTC